MKKLIIVLILFISIMFLTSCGSLRERLLAAPKEVQIPDGSLIATCVVDDITHKYVFQNDGVYQYLIDDVVQGDELLNAAQEQAFLHGESVQNYLEDEYGINGCIIEDYNS